MPSDLKYKNPLFVGVDVGGTNIKIGIVDDLGQIVAQTKFPTQPDKTPEVAVAQARAELDQLLASVGFTWGDVAAAGLGTPGPMNIETGTILTPTNLPGWHNFPIRDALSQGLDKPVTFANDAGAAGFGEYWVGGGQAYSSMVLLTLGTGVGGGIIVDEFSIDGANSHGAEVGHMVIETGPTARVCGCGHAGHLEAYASATALVDRTIEALTELEMGEATLLRDRIGEASPLSALMISQAATEGDAFAQKMIQQTAQYLGRGIALLAHIIDPAAFILGGAMNFGGSNTPLGQQFLSDVMTETRQHVFPVLGEKLVVKFAKLGGEAGFVGAAGLARVEFMKKSQLASQA